jgi:hypothetical protein
MGEAVYPVGKTRRHRERLLLQPAHTLEMVAQKL